MLSKSLASAVLSFLIAAALCVAAAPAHALSVTRTFYIDSSLGSDQSAGTSSLAPWKSFSRLSGVGLRAGDTVLLRRGRTWTSGLTLSAAGASTAPIVVDAYGSESALPRITSSNCLVLNGSYTVVRNLHVDACSWAGVAIAGHHNTVTASLMTGNVAGVNVKAGAADNVISRNTLRDNNRMSVVTPEAGDDSGAWGILLKGDRTEVAFNTISGSDAFSYDYVRDGAAIEIYGAQGSHIHHNVAIDNNMFSELGNSRSANNVYAYNVVRSKLTRGGFLTTRGAKSSYGPVLNTVVLNNTVYLEGSESQGLVCHAGCTPQLLKARNNIIRAVKKVGYADAAFDEDYGVYWGGRMEFPVGSHSRVTDALLVNPSLGDLRLSAASPAIDSGEATSYTVDVTGATLPRDGNGDGVRLVDRGAYER